MELLINSYNHLSENYTEYNYSLPVDRDINEAIAEAKRLHPSWTSMVITIVNPEGGDRC